MRRTILMVACLGLFATLGGTEARAQMMPNWAGPMGQMMQQNMMFDAAMAQHIDNVALQYFYGLQDFRQATGYQGYIPGPFSPGDVSRSIAGANQAFDDYNQSWAENSQRAWDATGRYARGAVRGMEGYLGPNGYVDLPYGPERTFGNALDDFRRGGIGFDPNIGNNIPYQEMYPVPNVW